MDNHNKHKELTRDPVTVPGSERVILQDEQYDEAIYPPGWDFDEFKSLPSFKDRIRYLKRHMGKIGAGSARIVFDIDPETSFKLAKNKKGIMQNRVEIDIGTKGWYSFVAKVYDNDEEGLWLEAEKARKMKPSDFKQITGFDFNEWVYVLQQHYNEMKGKRFLGSMLVSDDYDDILESDLFSEMISFMADFDMSVGDIARISSWGIVSRDGKEQPVLIDYGLTQDVFKDFYLKK